MKKVSFKKSEVIGTAKILECKVEIVSAILTLKDGSRMTTELTIIRDTKAPLLNISNCVTYLFDDVKELENYLNKKFEIFESDKEMYQTFTGMDDETWEEWNK